MKKLYKTKKENKSLISKLTNDYNEKLVQQLNTKRQGITNCVQNKELQKNMEHTMATENHEVRRQVGNNNELVQLIIERKRNLFGHISKMLRID